MGNEEFIGGIFYFLYNYTVYGSGRTLAIPKQHTVPGMEVTYFVHIRLGGGEIRVVEY